MASSKKNKLGKLKQAAREHLDETIGEGSGASAERPQSDMRDFMESMPGRDKSASETSASKTSAAGSGERGTPPDASRDTPETGAESALANEDSAAPEGAGETRPSLPAEHVPEETVVEVESDLSAPAVASSSAGESVEQTTKQPAENGEAGQPTEDAEPPPESASEIELPNGGQTAAYAGRAAARPERPKSMPKTRDSIYNVSSDIRLEDYTEGSSGSGGGGRMGTIAKIGGVLVLLGLLGWGGQQFLLWLDAPVYRVTVANELIDDTNAATLAAASAIVLSSSAPVHIRFDWEEGDLVTDFLRIEILHAAGGQVEAAQERRPPLTANYVYFMGPLDPGSYRIRVLDRESSLLVERDFRVN